MNRKKIAADTENVNQELKVVDVSEALRMAERCSNYNDSRNDARDFRCRHFSDVTFVDKDMSGVEAHYTRFSNCRFENVNLSRGEMLFGIFEKCVFVNCNLCGIDFSFAVLDVQFQNCSIKNADFSFARGSITAQECIMERLSAQNSHLKLNFSFVNGNVMEANFSNLDFDVSDSSLCRSEFNDGVLQGHIIRTDLTCAEMCRSKLHDLTLTDCAVSRLDTEDADGFSSDFDDLLQELCEEED